MSVEIFACIIGASLLARSASLMAAGLVYGILSAVHMELFTLIPDHSYGYYYAAATTFDLAVIGFACYASKAINPDWHLFPLSVVMLVSIVNNVFGCIVWFFYIGPEIYNIAGIGIYSAAIIILAGSRFDVGRLFGTDSAADVRSVSTHFRHLLGRQESIK